MKYVPSAHRPRAGAVERQQAVYAALAMEPKRPLTLEEIYEALGYAQTHAEVKSAISCLRVQRRVEIAVRGIPSTYRAVVATLRKVGER